MELGDGTISQVVHGYMLADGCAKGCAIGIISSGTGGDFVRTTKTPKDPVQALVTLPPANHCCFRSSRYQDC